MIKLLKNDATFRLIVKKKRLKAYIIVNPKIVEIPKISDVQHIGE